MLPQQDVPKGQCSSSVLQVASKPDEHIALMDDKLVPKGAQ